ncbi:MAG: peptidyl-prolyl cis-trans isomerase, partial [Desulfobacula sp.]|nr:peptidyl-prolyl cis-trans isomerase [Desulfobacula sp.]
QLLARIKAGEDMAALARQYSNDRYRIKGGDYGFIHMGRLDPDLEKQLMTLEVNKISDVIETRFGYHLARIEEIKPPTQLSYEQAAKKIKIQLAEEKKKSLKKALISMLREKAKIVIY